MHRPIQVVAVDQTMVTPYGIYANPDIRNWVVQTIGDQAELAQLWKLGDDQIQMESDWFGALIFDNLVDARDYIQGELDRLTIN